MSKVETVRNLSDSQSQRSIELLTEIRKLNLMLREIPERLSQDLDRLSLVEEALRAHRASVEALGASIGEQIARSLAESLQRQIEEIKSSIEEIEKRQQLKTKKIEGQIARLDRPWWIRMSEIIWAGIIGAMMVGLVEAAIRWLGE